MQSESDSHRLLCLDARLLDVDGSCDIAAKLKKELFFTGRGKSMLPYYWAGDTIVVREVPSVGDLKVGDIVVYQRDRKVFCHRVVRLTADSILTKPEFGGGGEHTFGFRDLIGIAGNPRNPRCFGLILFFYEGLVKLTVALQDLNLYKIFAGHRLKRLSCRLVFKSGQTVIGEQAQELFKEESLPSPRFDALHLWVCSGDEVVANLELLENVSAGRRFEIHNVFVRIPYRKLGIADRMLQLLEIVCEKAGVDEIVLKNQGLRGPAEKFLRSQGFALDPQAALWKKRIVQKN